jgi:putative ABC transport system permease protein
MSLWYSFRIALRALAVNKARTALTALGVIIGVGAVISMVGLGQGFGAAITREINAAGANWIWVAPTNEYGGPGPRREGRLTMGDAEALTRRHSDTIVSAVPFSMGSATVQYGAKSTATRFYGSQEQFLRVSNMTMQHGAFIRPRDVEGRLKVVVLGAQVTEALTGSPTTDLTGETVLINRQAFKVIGVMAAKGQFLMDNNDDTVVVPISTAMRRLMNTDRLALVAVQAADQSLVPRVEDQIRRTIRQRHDIKPPYADNDDFYVLTQEGAMQQVSMITMIISMLLGSIAAISLMVGGVGIMNIMLVSVTERTREIGLRKSVGATTTNIMSQFLIESVMVSVLGGLVGIALGLLGLWGVATVISANTAVKVDNVVSMTAVLVAFGVSAAIGIVFGLYPAWRAARLDPITALRYE